MPCVVAIDLEGTGLLNKDTENPHHQPGIVEFGALKVYTGGMKQAEYFSVLMDPEVHFEEKAQEITGIKAEDVYGKPNFREVFKGITDFMLSTECLITFNGIGYDIPLLQFTLQRYGLETNFPWPPIHFDLMKISTDVLNLQGKTGNKPPKLIELYANLFGKEFENQHRALSDAQATMECAMELISRGYIRI